MRTLGLFFCLVSAAMPATITLSTTCASGSATDAGAGNCLLKDTTGSANAQASATFIVSANTVTFDAETSATASTGGNTASFGFASFFASATVAVTANLETTGPARQGYLEVSGGSQTGSGGDGGGSANYSIGQTLNFSCPVNSSCNAPQTLGLIPIELGTSFGFTATQSANGETDPVDFLGDGKAITSETFTFFEADGVTPVAVSEVTSVPEPGTLTLLWLGLTAIVALRVRP